MKTITFEGSSDDTFGCNDIDHDDCAAGSLRVFEIEDASGAGLIVTGQYCPAATLSWVIGVGQKEGLTSGDEPDPLPAWPMRFRMSGRPYSPALEIDAPDDATVKRIVPDPDEDE